MLDAVTTRETIDVVIVYPTRPDDNFIGVHWSTNILDHSIFCNCLQLDTVKFKIL